MVRMKRGFMLPLLTFPHTQRKVPLSKRVALSNKVFFYKLQTTIKNGPTT